MEYSIFVGCDGLYNFTFEWDKSKNDINIEKHNISFNEAVTVFTDENAVFIADVDHSDAEERFIILGMSHKPRLLVVCHCYRESDTVIKIISARKANRHECKTYGGVS